MAVINPPLWLQAGAYNARQDRRLISSLVKESGVAGSLDLFVSQRGAGPNMSVDVLEGRAFIWGSEATTQGAYHVETQGDTNVVLAAAHATLPRYDLIVARVRDAEYSGAVNAWALEVVQGTAAGAPVEPTPPASSITLARITVAPAVTSIVNANILDRRPRARVMGGVSTATSTTLPSILGVGSAHGDLAYATDLDSLYFRTASSWLPLGHARVVNLGSALNAASLSYVNLGGSLVLPAGRWLIHAKGATVSTVGNHQFDVQLYNETDATELDSINIFNGGPFRQSYSLMGWATLSASKTFRTRGRVTTVTGVQTVDFGKMWATPVTAII